LADPGWTITASAGRGTACAVSRESFPRPQPPYESRPVSAAAAGRENFWYQARHAGPSALLVLVFILLLLL